MKKLWFFSILLAIIAILAFSVPALAGPTSTCTIVKGIEIFPGINILGNKYGATFVAEVSDSGALAGDNGVLQASINYIGTGPKPPSNTIFGGSWTLTVTSKGKVMGTIFGKVVSGIISWSSEGKSATDLGTIDAPPLALSITGGTATYSGIKGTGTFTGHDNHVSTIILAGIMVPIVDGTLELYY